MRTATLLAVVAVALGGEPQCSPAVTDCFASEVSPQFSEVNGANPATLTRDQRDYVCSRSNWEKKERCNTDCPLQLIITDPPELRSVMCVTDNSFAPYKLGQHLDKFFHPVQGKIMELQAVGVEGASPPTRHGCQPSDYLDGRPLAGKIAIIKRGTCYFYQKFQSAAAAGAAASVMVNHLLTNSIDGQMLTMTGNSEGFDDMPAVFAPRHYGNILFKALDAGVKVMGKLQLQCDERTKPDPFITDGCPDGSLIPRAVGEEPSCNYRLTTEDRLCVRCPVEAKVENHNLTTCLWGSLLLPRDNKNYMQFSNTLPMASSKVVYIEQTADEGCTDSDFAGLEGMYVYIASPTACLPFEMLQAAERMQVAGVISIAPLSQTNVAILPQGNSRFVSIPVHSVSPVEGKALAALLATDEFTKHRKAYNPTTIGLPLSVTFTEGEMPMPLIPLTPIIALPTKAVQVTAEGRPAFEATATVIVCLVLSICLLLAIIAKCAWNAKYSPTPSGMLAGDEKPRLAIPLAAATITISLSMLVVIAIVAFVLANEAGKESTDTAVENGNMAARVTYQNAEDNVLGLSKTLRRTMIGNIQRAANAMLADGALVAQNAANLYLGNDGSWASFKEEFPRLVEQGRSTGWSPGILTDSSFYAYYDNDAISYMTDDRPDAVRLDGLQHVSVTRDAKLYGVSTYQYDPLTLSLTYWSSLDQEEWRPENSLGGGDGDPHSLTRGKSPGFKQWYFTADTWNTELNGIRKPISVYTPVYNRAGTYVGAAFAHIEATGIRDILVAAAAGDATLFIYDRDNLDVLATNVWAPLHNPFAMRTVGITMKEGTYKLNDIPSVELLAFAKYYETHPLREDPVTGEWAMSGSFDQRELYPHSHSFYLARLETGADRIADTSGGMFDAELRGGVCTDINACSAYEMFNGVARKVMRFDGDGSLLHIYMNLTTDIPRVAKTKTSGPGEPWQSSSYQYRDTMDLPGATDKQCVAWNFFDPASETRKMQCMLRDPFYGASFTTMFRFKSDVAIAEELTADTPTLVYSGQIGEAAVKLLANGMLYLGAISYGCRVSAVKGGIPAGEWVTIAAVVSYENATCAVYYNGVKTGEGHILSSFGINIKNSVDGFPLSVGKSFRGHMADVMLFSISMNAQEMHDLHVQNKLVRDVPSKKWFVDVSTVVHNSDVQGGINWGVGVLLPRDSIMKHVDDNNVITIANLAIQEENARKKQDQITNESVMILIVLMLFSVLLFIVFNEMLTNPVSEVAGAMCDAAVMRIQTIPDTRSYIRELDLMFRAMRQMLENLESYRPFLPDALFENMQWVPNAPERDNALPPGMRTGVVAMVFTDIQGSTQLWEKHPTGMKTALKVHNEVIRRCIEVNEGYEVKTIGDAYMVAFDKANSAVNFGLEVQKMLHGADWPEDIMRESHCKRDDTQMFAGLRIRIGINFGEVDLDFNPVNGRYDYFGHTVNKASRIEAMGVAGAVTCSQEVLDEVYESRGELDETGSQRYSVNSNMGDLSSLKQPASLYALGSMELKGVAHRCSLSVILPVSLIGRATYVKEEIKSKREKQTNGIAASEHHVIDAIDRRSSGASKLTKQNSGGAYRAHSRLQKQQTKFERKANVTVGRIAIFLDGLEHPETVMKANEAMSKVMSCLERSDGTIVSVLACSVAAGWNTSRSCAAHLDFSFRFLRLLKTSVQDRVEFYNCFAVGLCSGSVLYGNVGNHMQKFITIVGSAVKVSGHLSSSAAQLGVYCLHAAIPGEAPSAYTDPNLCKLCRPVDTWPIVNKMTEIRVFQAKTEAASVVPTDWQPATLEDGQEMAQIVTQQNWGWSDDYADAFDKKDHFKISTYGSKDDETLLEVAKHLQNGTHLRPPVRL